MGMSPFLLSMQNRFPCINPHIGKSKNVVRVLKTDGKILDYNAPILVKHLVMKFKGFGVGLSRKPSKCLPPNFELKLGKRYYLLPLPVDDQVAPHADTAVPSDQGAKTKRMKVVITKQQLHELLLKKISVEEIILGTNGRVTSTDCDRNWKPRLASIAEEKELYVM